MKRQIKFILIFCLLCIQFINPSIAANNKKFSGTLTNRGLVLTPVITYLEGDRGQVIKGSFTITNDYQSPQFSDLFFYPKNFVTDANGSPANFSVDGPMEINFAKWFTLEENTYHLEHKEIKEINYTVTIPQNAEGGTHSAVIFITKTKEGTVDNLDPTTVGVHDQIGLPVFLTIKRDLKFDSSIFSVFVTDTKNIIRNTFWYGTAKTHVIVENSGNIYIKPYGDFFIYKSDKTKPVKSVSFNPNGYLVQQSNKREFVFDYQLSGFINEEEHSWFRLDKYNFSKFFDMKFGKYHVMYSARIKPANEAHLDADRVIIDKKNSTFFVFPIQLMMIICVILLIIFIMILKMWRNSRNNHSLLRFKNI